MTDRFQGLKKLPDVPAAKVLAEGGAKLQTSCDAPASAGIPDVLAELEAKGAVPDMLLLLAHALPVREAVWWACLSARDTLPDGQRPPAPLAAAEAWVLKPGEEARYAARQALDAAGDDDTALCAMAACCADGTLGPGEYEDYDAPPGAVALSAYSMALISIYHDDERADAQGDILLERALDIARGGSGRLESLRTTEPNEA